MRQSMDRETGLASNAETVPLKLCIVGFWVSLACAMIFAFVSSQIIPTLAIVAVVAILVLALWMLHQHSDRSRQRDVEAAWAALHQNTSAVRVTVIEKENAA